MNNYKYSDLATKFLPEGDWIHLAHEGGCRKMEGNNQADENSPEPIASCIRSRVAKSMNHIALMKSIPKLHKLQDAAFAKRNQRDADVTAGHTVSPNSGCLRYYR
jgi:hypothetical protein